MTVMIFWSLFFETGFLSSYGTSSDSRSFNILILRTGSNPTLGCGTVGEQERQRAPMILSGLRRRASQHHVEYDMQFGLQFQQLLNLCVCLKAENFMGGKVFWPEAQAHWLQAAQPDPGTLVLAETENTLCSGLERWLSG